MNINCCYPVMHDSLLLAGSGERASSYFNHGRRLSASPPSRQRRSLVCSTRTLRTRQRNGLDFSTAHSISPPSDRHYLSSKGIFMSFCGPEALTK
jgi:hypothetical protein